MPRLPGRNTGKIALLIAATAVGLPVMAQTWQIPKPTPGLMPNVTAGKTLFAKNCASCHGADLKGSKEGPPFLHPYYVPSHHGDAAFQLAVKNGVTAHHWRFGDMKPLPEVTPDEVAHITAFVRFRQRKAGIK